MEKILYGFATENYPYNREEFHFQKFLEELRKAGWCDSQNKTIKSFSIYYTISPHIEEGQHLVEWTAFR